MERISRILRKPLTAVILSIIMGLFVGAIVLAVSGYNPFEAYAALFRGIFSKPKYVAIVIVRSTPIILTGLSVAFAFKTGLFNIGAEGQYIVGSIAAVLVGYLVPMPPVIHFFAIILTGAVAAGLYGGFAGFLKARFGIHEVITTIMLNWVALYLNNFFVKQPWLKKPNTEASHEIAQTGWGVFLNGWKTSPDGKEWLSGHPILLDLFRTDLNYGIIVAVLVVIGVWYLLNHTTKGFELRAVGFNQDAAEFAGINVKNNMITSMGIAGALSGLAGALQICCANPHRITILAAHEGFGFDGISVALIAGSNPIGCIFSGLLFGGLKYGGASIQSEVGAPTEVISIVIGTIVFFVAMSTIFTMLADRIKRRAEKK